MAKKQDIRTTQELNQALKDLTNTIKEQTRQISNSDRAYESLGNNLEKNRKTTKKVHAEAKNLTETLVDLYKTIKQPISSSLKKELSETVNYTKDIKELSIAYKKYSSEVSNMQKTFSALGVASSATLKDLITQGDKANKAISSVFEKDKIIKQFNNQLSDLPNKFSKIKEKLEKDGGFDTLDKSVDSLKKQLSEIKDNLPEKEAKDFSKIISNLNLKKIDDLENVLDKLKSGLIYLKPDVNINASEFEKKIKKALHDASQISIPFDKNELFKDLEETLDSLNINDELKKVLSTKEASDAMYDLKKALAEPLSNFDEITSKFNTLNEIIGKDLQGLTSNLSEELTKAKNVFNNITDDLRKNAENFIDTKSIQENLSGIKAQLTDFSDHIHRTKFSLEMKGFVADEDLVKSKELLTYENKISNLLRDVEEELTYIESSETDITKKKELLLDLETKVKKEYEEETKKLRMILDTSQKYLEVAEKTVQTGFGSKEADEVRDKLFKLSIEAKRFSDKLINSGSTFGNIFGKQIQKLSKSLGNLGSFMKTMALPISIFTASVASMKLLLELQSKLAAQFQEIANEGLQITNILGSKGMGASLSDALTKTTNLAGLSQSVFDSKEIVQNRKEITSTVGALGKAGLPIQNLKEQMKGVNTTTAASTNEFLNAANVVKTFSTNLGTSDSEIANSIGGMMYEYNTSMKKLKDNFTVITKSAQESGMSTNRFLGIVQTSTAGLSLYDDQVRETAESIAQLSKNSSLSGKGLEDAAKSATEFANDTMKAIKGFAYIMTDKEAIDKMKANLQKAINDVQVKLQDKTLSAKERAQAEGQLKHMQLMQGGLEQRNAKVAGAELKYSPVEIQMQLIGSMLKKMSAEVGPNNTFEIEKFAENFQLSPQLIKDALSTDLTKNAAAMENIKKALMDKQELDKTSKEQIQNAADLTHETHNTIQEAVNAGIDTLLQKIGPSLKVLTGLAGLGAVFSAGWILTKGLPVFVKNLGGLGGGGGNNPASEALETATDMFNKESGAAKGAGKVGKIAKGFGKVKNFLKIGKSVGRLAKLGVVTTALTSAMDFYNTYDEAKSAKEAGASDAEISKIQDKGYGKATGKLVGAVAGGIIGSFAGPLGTVAGAALGDYLGGMAGEYIGEKIADNASESMDEKIDPNKKIIPAKDSKAFTRDLNKVPVQLQNGLMTQILNPSAPVSPLSSSSAAVGALSATSPLDLLTNPNIDSNIINQGSTTQTNTSQASIVININGGDTNQVRRVVKEEIQNAVKSRQTT